MSANISANWFRDVIEPLADSFEPAAVDRYVHLFTEAIGRPDLVERYQQVRRPRAFTGPDPAEVFVLSRVTLGADVAITSTVLDAARQRFPHSRIGFVGPRKNFGLFESDAGLHHVELKYVRSGTLEERMAASEHLASLVDREEAIVVDPDSRLTQLGLVPVCDPSRYFFFESRSAQGTGSLTELTSSWLYETFGVRDARPFLAANPPEVELLPEVTVSLGVGENPDKRVADPFERCLLELLSATGRRILVDEGAGGEETERVLRAIDGLPNVRTWRGAFAPFAALIASSGLYVGYDSAGQHVAAACGVPLITVFAGFPNLRFLERWRPTGPGRIDLVVADSTDPAPVIDRVASLLAPGR